MGVISGTLPFAAGIGGDSVLGNGSNPRLGPVNFYAGSSTPTQLTGTIEASASDTITGTGTAFDTELAVGDYVRFDAETTTYKVLEVNSATDILIDTVVTHAALTDIYKVNLIWMGCSTQTVFRYGITKTELKEACKGDVAADRAVTGYTTQIESDLTRASLERLQRVLNGFDLHYDVNGNLDGAGFGFPIGATDLEDYSQQLHIVRIDKGVESADPLDHLVIPKAAFTTDVEQTFDATSQHTVKVTANAYIDNATTLNGASLLWFLGNIT